MKLLFDENLSRRLVVRLGGSFPGSSHVALEGLRQAVDLQIWRYAADNGFIIVTKDSDFRELVTLHNPPPKVVVIRLGNCSTSDIVRLLLDRLAIVEAFASDPSSGLLILE